MDKWPTMRSEKMHYFSNKLIKNIEENHLKKLLADFLPSNNRVRLLLILHIHASWHGQPEALWEFFNILPGWCSDVTASKSTFVVSFWIEIVTEILKSQFERRIEEPSDIMYIHIHKLSY